MVIEVTRKTFDLIFTQDLEDRIVSKGHYNKYYYYNKETEQQGFIIENFLSNVEQFYLKDINA